MCPPPIFFVRTYVVVLEKLSDTYFLRAQNGFKEEKITAEKCGTKYPFNCFTYNNRIFHNQTNSKNILTMRDEICDFFQLDKKDFWRVNYPTICLNYTKNLQTDIIST